MKSLEQIKAENAENRRFEKRAREERVDAVLASVRAELLSAMEKHRPLNSLHEAYAVILEELDELWDECRKKREDREPDAVQKELTQIAAMAVRAIYDLVPQPPPRPKARAAARRSG